MIDDVFTEATPMSIVTTTPGPSPPMLTSADVATLCRVSPATIRQWHSTGKLPKATKLGGQYLWRSQDIEALIARHSDVELS